MGPFLGIFPFFGNFFEFMKNSTEPQKYDFSDFFKRLTAVSEVYCLELVPLGVGACPVFTE